MKVLFVCRANVGRSQMANAFFNKLSKKNKSECAGTNVGENEGKTIGENEKAKFVVDVMKEENIDVSEQKRRQLTEDMINKSDKIIVMADKKDVPDYLINSEKTEFLEY